MLYLVSELGVLGMLAVKFALHDALSIVLQRFLLMGSLSLKLLLPQLILQVCNVLP